MTILFVGGSNTVCINPHIINDTLAQLGIPTKDISTVVCGLDEGPERAGREWGIKYNKYLDEHVPHLEQYGKGLAYVIRNKVIISHANLMLMYWDGKSAGTRNLMNAGAKHGGTRVYKIQVEGIRISHPVSWDRVVPEEEWGWTSQW
jgi:hypothetical protein